VRQLLLALISCVVGLAGVYAVAKVLGFGPGWGAGLLAGGLTQSSVIGVADGAISGLHLSASVKQQYINQIPVGYAVCYLCGTAVAAYFLSRVAPRLVGTRDLAAECRELEKELGITDESAGTAPAYATVVRRAYRIEPGSELDGRSVQDEERLAAQRGRRIFIYRYRPNGGHNGGNGGAGGAMRTEPGTVLHAGDVVTVTATHADFIAGAMTGVGTEVDDPDLLSYQVETRPVIVTSKKAAGRTIAELCDAPGSRLLFVRSLTRGRAHPSERQDRAARRRRGRHPRTQGAGRRGGRATRLRRPRRQRHRPVLRRAGHRPRRPDRHPGPDHRRRQHRAHHQWRRLDHGPGLRLAALAAPDLRPLPGGGAVADEHRRPLHVRWDRRDHLGSGLHQRRGQRGCWAGLGGLVVTLLPMVVCLYLGRYLFKFNTPELLGIIALLS